MLALIATALLLGAVFIALAVRNRKSPAAIPLAILGTALVLYAVSEIFDPQRIRGILAPTLLFVAAVTSLIVMVLAITAVRLWRLHTVRPPQAPDESRANLAIAVGGGAVVTLLILLVQTVVQVIDYQQNLANQRETIRLALASQSDLSGLAAPLDPADGEILDMSGYWLRGKKLTWASLNEVEFRGANFVFSDLSGAMLRGTDLSADTDGQRTDLRAASLYWSDLTNATVGNASFVDADLRRAYLCGVDLSQADLTRADLREANLDVDPQTGEPCVGGPASLPPRDAFPSVCWPDEVDAHSGCGGEARWVVCLRDGRVPQAPAPDSTELVCEDAD